ncbi:hypothetical protein [Streptomyces sp. NPDC050564]|uniref:hypothetical protein n=1 Tax=Streptomyces sp. NPDC050564 TaxID=3365631 RepID=UPI0037B5818C
MGDNDHHPPITTQEEVTAVFNFGGKQVDSSDADALVKAAEESGVAFGGSLIVGNSYGVTGGTVHCDVKGIQDGK